MSKVINILIAIDTDAVKRQYPNPSKSSTSPTGIAHNLGYMVATGTTIVSGQGTGDLNINALIGDLLRVFATSGSDNFEDAVLLYNLPKYKGDQVLGDFRSVTFTRSTVVPGSRTNVLPPNIVDEQFWFYEADIVSKGTEGYMVQFGLWTRDANEQPVLYGYFGWDPTITVPH